MNIEKLEEYIVDKIRNEISEDLSYHNLAHTQDVLKQCNQYIDRLNISEKDANLLRTAALLHDIGFLWVYENHEERGVQYANEELPKWGYSSNEIKIISGMIMATKIPQSPKTLLEKIICDADLDYLATDSFTAIGTTLHQEFLAYNRLNADDDWNSFQIKFLQHHKFRTAFAKEYKEPIKQIHLNNLTQNHS